MITTKCQGCGETIRATATWVAGKGWSRSWCSQACKQRTLRDRKILALAAGLDSSMNKATLRELFYELYGSQTAQARQRETLRLARLAPEGEGL